MIPLRDFVPEWNSRPGTTTGVNSRRGDSRRHDILWWYHINKCRAMRGNWCELTPVWKSPRYDVNSPLCWWSFWYKKFRGPSLCVASRAPWKCPKFDLSWDALWTSCRQGWCDENAKAGNKLCNLSNTVLLICFWMCCYFITNMYIVFIDLLVRQVW